MTRTQKVLGTLSAVAMVGVLAAGAIVIKGQHEELGRLSAQLGELRTLAQEQREAQKSAEAATNKKVATLSSSITAVENRLTSDERRLDLTVAGLPPDVSALARSVVPSVVFLGCGSGVGTGFALDLPSDDGQTIVVTAAHVVADCADGAAAEPEPVSVTSEDRQVSADVLVLDAKADVALVSAPIDLPRLRPASKDPGQGDFVMAVGNPLGAQALANSVTQGTVSKIVSDHVTHTAPISSGNSGGPLVNRKGEVVAIVSALIPSDADGQFHTENLNIAVRLRALCNAALQGPSCSLLH